MKYRFKFDNLHKSKKHAFVDGFLTALVVAWLIKITRDEK